MNTVPVPKHQSLKSRSSVESAHWGRFENNNNNKCRSVSRTLRHQSDGAEMSWVRSVLGPKCLDTDAGVDGTLAWPSSYLVPTYYPRYITLTNILLNSAFSLGGKWLSVAIAFSGDKYDPPENYTIVQSACYNLTFTPYTQSDMFSSTTISNVSMSRDFLIFLDLINFLLFFKLDIINDNDRIRSK